MGAMDLAAHVDESLRRRCKVTRGTRMVVAVSGGCDSMALLHLLCTLASAHRWQLAVAHLNHQLRGRSSAADERLVVRTAKRAGLPVFVERAAVRDFAKAHKLSLEMAARRVRHAFLARVAANWEASTVALAHHADDQVELFFVRLFRGAGGEGLGGMKWQSRSPASPDVALVRPLLDIPRCDLEQFAAEHRLRYREDASNASLDILRNRIRHELLPRLKRRYQPALARTVLRVMDILGEESATVRALAQSWLRKRRRSDFRLLSLAVQRASLREQLSERGVVADFDLVAQLLAEAGQRVSVGAHLSVSRDQTGKVHLHENKSVEFNDTAAALKLQGRAGEASFAKLRVRWRLTGACGDARPAPAPNCEFFDADAVGPEITLRHWRPGDRFQPIGLPRPAKLQDLLTNARIPRERRRGLVVAAAADGRLFWVEGLRIGEPFKLTPRTIRRLQWRWHPL